jgi:hypothetical protein
MPKKQQNQQQQQQQMSGGEGAADWGLKAYGDANQQHAISATDNAIAVNPSSCGATATMKGGARQELQQLLNQKMQEMQQQQQSSQDGGSFMQQLSNLVDLFNKKTLSENDMNNTLSMMSGGSGVLENIAVPAILLYLNQRIGQKSNSAKNHKSMKLRKSSRSSYKKRRY